MPNTLPQTTVIAHLPSTGLLAIESADNLKFLQGQFTCDVRDVSSEQWRYGALCTNQGRMISNFLLTSFKTNHHLLRLHASTLEAVQNTLKKFAPFYKGTLEDMSSRLVVVGIAGTNSAQLIESAFSSASAEANSSLLTDKGMVLRLDEQRFQCFIYAERFDKVWQALSSQAKTIDEAQWDLINIRAGLGEVRDATIESWTPHMLNLQAISAINFKKGCYTGQEIVARTEYRGQNKKAMYRIQGTGSVPPSGEAILDGEQNAGEIVMASTCGEHWEALAVLNEKHIEQALSCLQQLITLLDLPYTIPKKS